MSAVPYTFAHRTGNIQLEELDINFANVKAYANTAGLVLTGNQYNITSVGTLVSLTVAGNLAVGNISANNSITAASLTSANISSTGNVTGINLNGTSLAVSDATVYGNLASINGYFTNNITANTANILTLTSVNIETNFIRSADSTVVAIDDGLEVYGNTMVNGLITADTASINTASINTAIINTANISTLTSVNVETNFIRSADSTVVAIDDGLEVYGNTTINGELAVNTVAVSLIRSDDSSVVGIDDGVEIYGDALINGNVIANNFVSNGNTAVLSAINRTIYVSNVAPTSGDGNDGDIWFQTV